ncbi:hypothetical protein ACIBHX_25355 [Nonomuraea sp. NPDC050536]|uniref:hypothetical protein n=1 Tax=Nonomuraea sp. NPDC050536 TaxID=3364366 RepID=UPI0037C7B0C9
MSRSTWLAGALIATSCASPTPSTAAIANSAPIFSANVTNPWFPLKPGTTFVYRGVKDGEAAVEHVRISKETKKIDGKPCRIVLDLLYLKGKLAETTRDYYSQDSTGNVWYVGEDTAELEPDGAMVTTEGTWHAGDSGARAGIYITADPQVGQPVRQEYDPGHAEDYFMVIDMSAPVTVPYKAFPSALVTKEWTPLEPDVLDHKYYVHGVGLVKEKTVHGEQEEFALVKILSQS